MIVAAAIRINGNVYGLPAPARHHDIIRYLADGRIEPPIRGEQGFIDDGAGFVGRKEAAVIALEEGQVKQLIAPPNLFSEDVW